MIWLIIGVVCFLLLRNFLSKLEIDDRNGWEPFKAPLWSWALAAIVCLIPIINIVGLVCVVFFVTVETRSPYPDLRFKEGNWITKLIDFMKKKF